jgi:hypothetical protein
MINRIANAKRVVIAIFAVALCAFSAIFAPVSAVHAHHATHSCHRAIHQTDAAGDHQAAVADELEASSASDRTAAHHTGGGHAPSQAGPDCRLACSMAALTSLAEPVFACREAVAVPFEPLEQDADSLAPERLSRPPKSPLA